MILFHFRIGRSGGGFLSWLTRLLPAMITESQLRALMQNEEGQHLEFKRSLCDRREIAEYTVGIGNEGGGWLFMGITNKKPRRIVGIKTPTKKDLQQMQRSVWDSTNIRVETHLINTCAPQKLHTAHLTVQTCGFSEGNPV